MISKVWWLAWRLGVTFLCAHTIQKIIQEEGYFIELPILLNGALLIILMIRIWAPNSETKQLQFNSQEEESQD